MGARGTLCFATGAGLALVLCHGLAEGSWEAAKKWVEMMAPAIAPTMGGDPEEPELGERPAVDV